MKENRSPSLPLENSVRLTMGKAARTTMPTINLAHIHRLKSRHNRRFLSVLATTIEVDAALSMAKEHAITVIVVMAADQLIVSF